MFNFWMILISIASISLSSQQIPEWDAPVTTSMNFPIRNNFVLFLISPDCDLDCFELLFESFIKQETIARNESIRWDTTVKFGNDPEIKIKQSDNLRDVLNCSTVSFEKISAGWQLKIVGSNQTHVLLSKLFQCLYKTVINGSSLLTEFTNNFLAVCFSLILPSYNSVSLYFFYRWIPAPMKHPNFTSILYRINVGRHNFSIYYRMMRIQLVRNNFDITGLWWLTHFSHHADIAVIVYLLVCLFTHPLSAWPIQPALLEAHFKEWSLCDGHHCSEEALQSDSSGVDPVF